MDSLPTRSPGLSGRLHVLAEQAGLPSSPGGAWANRERRVRGRRAEERRTEVLRLGLLTLAMKAPAQRALARPALWGRQGIALTGKRQLWASSPAQPSSREHVLRETSAVLPLAGGCSHSCSHRCSSALTHAHGDSHILLAPPTPALKLCMPSEELGASGTELHGHGTSGLAG